jgi:sporulation protein YabP
MEHPGARKEARTLAMPGAGGGPGQRRHDLALAGREQLTVTGVLAVESFDDKQIIMDTELGLLTLKGEDLNIKQLDLETGRFAVEGFVNSLVYTTPRNRGGGRGSRSRSWLERLLK